MIVIPTVVTVVSYYFSFNMIDANNGLVIVKLNINYNKYIIVMYTRYFKSKHVINS